MMNLIRYCVAALFLAGFASLCCAQSGSDSSYQSNTKLQDSSTHVDLRKMVLNKPSEVMLDVNNQPIDVPPSELIPFGKLLRYPEVARRSGLQGSVTLGMLVDTDGTVKDVRVLRSDYDIFKRAAIEAARSERFQPAMREGRPVIVWVTESCHFQLH